MDVTARAHKILKLVEELEEQYPYRVTVGLFGIVGLVQSLYLDSWLFLPNMVVVGLMTTFLRRRMMRRRERKLQAANAKIPPPDPSSLIEVQQGSVPETK